MWRLKDVSFPPTTDPRIKFLEEEMEQAVFQALMSNDKIPYTNEGMELIAREVRTVLERNGMTDVQVTIPLPRTPETNELTVAIAGTMRQPLQRVTFTGKISV